MMKLEIIKHLNHLVEISTINNNKRLVVLLIKAQITTNTTEAQLKIHSRALKINKTSSRDNITKGSIENLKRIPTAKPKISLKTLKNDKKNGTNSNDDMMKKCIKENGIHLVDDMKTLDRMRNMFLIH
jgi:hypothetical protein